MATAVLTGVERLHAIIEHLGEGVVLLDQGVTDVRSSRLASLIIDASQDTRPGIVAATHPLPFPPEGGPRGGTSHGRARSCAKAAG